MSNSWKEFTIEEIGDVIGGGTPSTKNPDYWEGDISWITPKDLSGYKYKRISKGERNITELGLTKSSAKLLPKNTVLITSRAPIGYVAIADNEVTTNQGFKSIVLKDGFDSDYVYYLIKSNVRLLESVSSGSTFKEISGNELKKLRFNFPELSQQKAIAYILGTLDDKIELNRKMNETLEQMAQALFKSWFEDDVKENWEEKSLSSIATFTNGLACQKFPPENDGEKLPVLKIKDLKSGISENSDWVTSNVDEKYLVFNGDIIFSWSASLLVKIWDGEDCVLNQHLFKVTSDNFPNWYIYLWCKYHLNKFISIAKAMATTMGHIKRKDLDIAMVLVPSSEELNEMTEKMKPLIDRIINNNKQISSLTKQRDVLLPQLISGKLRVSKEMMEKTIKVEIEKVG